MVPPSGMESKKCDVLVVDTAGFIKSARLEEIGDQGWQRKSHEAPSFDESYIFVTPEFPVHSVLHAKRPPPDRDPERRRLRDQGPRHQAAPAGAAATAALRATLQGARRGGLASWSVFRGEKNLWHRRGTFGTGASFNLFGGPWGSPNKNRRVERQVDRLVERKVDDFFGSKIK